MQNGPHTKLRGGIERIEFQNTYIRWGIQKSNHQEVFVQVIKEFKIPIEKDFIDSILGNIFRKQSKWLKYKATSISRTNMLIKKLT